MSARIWTRMRSCSNPIEARQTIAPDENLCEVIVRSIDIAAIYAEIEQLETVKRDLDDELDRLDPLDSQLPNL